jgi:hypothetical protein
VAGWLAGYNSTLGRGRHRGSEDSKVVEGAAVCSQRIVASDGRRRRVRTAAAANAPISCEIFCISRTRALSRSSDQPACWQRPSPRPRAASQEEPARSWAGLATSSTHAKRRLGDTGAYTVACMV